MIKNKHLCCLLLLLLLQLSSRAQDTARTLSKDGFLAIIKTYHPVISQAGLQLERAAADIQAARGAFDPAVDVGLDRKTFDGTLYYSYFNPQLTIPTWYGIDIKAGLEEVSGARLNPEASPGKTSYVGLKVPVNSLLFDSRRATLRQAQRFMQLTEANRLLAINDLLHEALAAYWNWVRAYQDYQLSSRAVAVNEERLQYVRTEYALGSRPAIDTTEALAQLQQFYMQQSDAWLEFRNAGLELSNYLWASRGTPVNWSERIIPAETGMMPGGSLPALEQLLLSARSRHPKLQGLVYKTDMLETERRLKGQYLLPKLSLNANLLSKGYSMPDELDIPFLEQNYKLGFDFSLPLFLREARGNYRAAGIKLQEIALEQDVNTLQIENKVRAYYNEVLQLGQQIAVYEQALDNYRRLLQGEQIRFEAGESTLFVLNARENKLIEASQKLNELRTKWHKSYASLLWAAGLLPG